MAADRNRRRWARVVLGVVGALALFLAVDVARMPPPPVSATEDLPSPSAPGRVGVGNPAEAAPVDVEVGDSPALDDEGWANELRSATREHRRACGYSDHERMTCDGGICVWLKPTEGSPPWWFRYWRRPRAYPEEQMMRFTGDESWSACFSSSVSYRGIYVYAAGDGDDSCGVFSRRPLERSEVAAVCEDARVAR